MPKFKLACMKGFSICLYWLAKEEIANVKTKSLLQLVEKLGCDVSGFNHTSVGSQRDMLLLLGEMIQNEVIACSCNWAIWDNG